VSDDLRYPIGPFSFPETVSKQELERDIEQIAQTPNELRKAIRGLTNEQLDTAYRPGGWTVRQVVHHLPDSHLNSYVRFKLAVTEDEPLVKAYDESRWAELEDARRAPIDASLTLLDSLHERWVVFLRSLDDTLLSRTFRHPEVGVIRVDQNVALYAWHGRHHVAHITSLREREGF
jgi:hypothetical protein